MQHVQLKVNLDETVCFDYYEENLYSAEVVNTIKTLVANIEHQVKRKVRRSPFIITKCESCGHLVITNRDILEVVKCQNCKKDFVVYSISEEDKMSDALLDEIHDTLGYKLEKRNEYIVYMLAFIPQTVDPSLISKIMRRYGFSATHCEGELYEKMLSYGQYNGWLTPNCKVGFGKTVLDDRDCLFDGVIPRVEACARFIQKYTENEVKTISAHVAPKKDLDKPSRFHQFDIRERIEKLVAEGKMEEAAALMDEI